MTNKEYLISQLGFAASAHQVEAALTDCEVMAADTYVKASSTTLKKAAIAVLQVLLSTADVTQGTGETANAIKYDRAAVLNRIKFLQDELGLSDGRTIKSRSVW